MTNMICPPAGDNYSDECGNDLKPATVQGYDRHMAYADEYDCMHDKEAIFTPLDFPILNSFILLTSCGSKLSHWYFVLEFVRDQIQEGEAMPQGRQPLPPVSQTHLTYKTTNTVPLDGW